jgi:hypothetical protein
MSQDWTEPERKSAELRRILAVDTPETFGNQRPRVMKCPHPPLKEHTSVQEAWQGSGTFEPGQEVYFLNAQMRAKSAILQPTR